MKRTLITAAAALAALASCATPAHAAGEQVIYSFCSDTQDIASLNWFDADNEQQTRAAIRLTNRTGEFEVSSSGEAVRAGIRAYLRDRVSAVRNDGRKVLGLEILAAIEAGAVVL